MFTSTNLENFVPENILYSLHCTLSLPYIIWDNTCQTYLDNVKKWAIRTISNNQYRHDNYKPHRTFVLKM